MGQEVGLVGSRSRPGVGGKDNSGENLMKPRLALCLDDSGG